MMGKTCKRFLALSCFVFGMLMVCRLPADAKLLLDVENPDLARMPIAVPDFLGPEHGPVNGREMGIILRNDLYLTGLFQIIESAPDIGQASADVPDFQNWARTGAQALVTVSYRIQGDQITLEAKLYDLAFKQMELGKRFSGNVRDHRLMVHRFAERIMERLTGIPGCFSTRIAFVGLAPSKDVFAMDFDGHNVQRIIGNGSINMSPEWSPDGRSILFTSYMSGKPDLWSFDFGAAGPRLVSGRPGLNASARYSPDGRSVALSSNNKGIPKIFIITPQGDLIKRLTDGPGNDISPTWSPDQSTIAYVSDQAGTPQIYTIPVSGGRPRRLTFQSNYNTDPDWSPRGTHLAFTARIDGRFQICTMRTDGTDFRVLTDRGSNQAPAWSPDGRLIAFSSNRDGTARVFIMDASGQIQVPVSPIPGKAPAWSPARR